MTASTFSFQVDRYCTPRQVIEQRYHARQINDRPHAVDTTLRPGVAPMDIVPSDATVISSYQSDGAAVLLAEGSGYVIYVESWASVSHIGVAADRAVTASEVLEGITAGRKDEPGLTSSTVAIWKQKSNGGGARSDRTLSAKSWEEIQRNYPRTVRRQMEAMVRRNNVDEDEGRLILFHGAPGTGKTTAIRALMHEWGQWCETHLITDPDRMFADSDYLINVLESVEGQSAPTLGSPPGEPKWKLVVAEDADPYLRSTARFDAGAALGRLLNATDGLLGQSTKTLVLLTTNEELTRLQPALIRPGRCLTRIEFDHFSPREAGTWFGDGRVGPVGESTLAELFEARRTGTSCPQQALSIGAYL